MNDVPARLIVKRGPNPGREYTLTPAEITIGRSASNVIAISDPEVSHSHQITGVVTLNDGDEIRLGDTILFYFLSDTKGQNLPPQTPHTTLAPAETDTIVEATPHRTDTAEQEESLSAPAQDTSSDEFLLPENKQSARRGRLFILGCGCTVLLIVCLCAATLFFLDAYQQGRLLYCGPLRPFFEIMLGPVGFAPICPS
jgi:predicted component of type VI protein secretion system